MKRFLILIIFFTFIGTTNTNAQFINTGQSRTSTKWRIIKSEDFNIIYPSYFEKTAQRTANLFYRIFKHNNSLNQKTRKISFIIHPDGGISNGNVGWAPKRSELYTIPPQDAGESWLVHLCIHESRHVVQFDKINQNRSKTLYYLFGEMAPMVLTGIYLPMWFLEGDATSFETSAGKIGRGRDPEFLNKMKSQIIDKGIYSLSKATCGSYKDFVPDKYIMGYFMTANTRKHYGNYFWAKVLNNISLHPFSITPFSYAIKENTHPQRQKLWESKEFKKLFDNPKATMEANTTKDGKEMLYLDNFNELQKIWQNDIKNSSKDEFTKLPTHNKIYCNYYNPQAIMNNSIVMYKKGLDNSGEFILYNNGNEYTLSKTGLLFDYNFDVHENKIIWSEYQAHTRWEHEGRMVIATYDIDNKKYKKYKGSNNRFSPFRTDSGWGCVETDKSSRSYIVLYNEDFSKILFKFKANDTEHFIHPSYYNGNIYTVIQTEKGNKISEINILTREIKTLLKNCNFQIDKPIIYNNNLYFRASFNTNNALYKINLKSKKLSNILNSKYGIRYASINNNTIYFSNYTSQGYKPCKMELSKIKSHKVVEKEFTLAENITKLENFNNSLNNKQTFSSKKYNISSNLLNIHSWGPLAIDINDFEVSPGLTIYSQNKLNTLQFYGGYKIKNDKSKWFLKGSYLGLFPKFDIECEHSKNTFYADIIKENKITTELDSLITKIKNSNFSSKVTMRIPLCGQYINYSYCIEPYMSYTYESLYNNKFISIKKFSKNYLETNTTIRDNYNLKINTITSNLLEYGLRINNFSRTSIRDINPRYGQYFEISNAKIYRKKNKNAYIFSTQANLYFPGIFKHHSLSLYMGYQKMPVDNILFNNKINEPRGITNYGYKLNTIQTNYTFPICYPDMEIFKYIYLKRVYINIFYDLCKEYSLLQRNNYNSYGIEIKNNINLFKLTIPLTLGTRIGYENKTNSCFFNITFAYNITI